MTPKNDDHPYHHKDIYIDKQTLGAALLLRLRPEGGALEDHLAQQALERGRAHRRVVTRAGTEVPEPRDARRDRDIIVNVQTGTGNRIEFWDAHGTPLPSKGKIRRYIDVGRLTKGR